MPLVSVIIPVYKSKMVLETAVKSVLSQSFTDFELLLIDDGSPDDSLVLCKELQKQDSRIRVFHKENGGICSARNYGIQMAKGKYIAFLDHDDEYLQGYLEDNIILLEKYQAEVIKFERLRERHLLDGRVSVIHGDRIKDMPGIENGILCYKGEQIADNYLEIRAAVKAMYIWDGIYSREFLVRHHLLFDETFKFGHEDIMFNMEVLTHAQVMIFHAKEYYKHKYRDSTSTSATFNKDRILDAIKTAKRECVLLENWKYPKEQILLSYTNELFRVLNILCLPGAKVSMKEKKECLNLFRNETYATLEDMPGTVKQLIKIKRLHGILAWFFWHRYYRICILFFKLYCKL